MQNNNEKVSLIILHGNNDGIHITAGVWLRFRCRPTFSMLYKSWNFMCKILRYKNPIVPSNFIYVYIFYSVFFLRLRLDVVVLFFIFLFYSLCFFPSHPCGSMVFAWMSANQTEDRPNNVCGPVFIIRLGIQYPMWQVNRTKPY